MVDVWECDNGNGFIVYEMNIIHPNAEFPSEHISTIYAHSFENRFNKDAKKWIKEVLTKRVRANYSYLTKALDSASKYQTKVDMFEDIYTKMF